MCQYNLDQRKTAAALLLSIARRRRKGKVEFMSFSIKDNKIFFVRAGEAACLSACGKDCIRFQAAPSGLIPVLFCTENAVSRISQTWNNISMVI